MKSIISPGLDEVMDAVHYRPAISIILPFEPKMNAKAQLLGQLKAAVRRVHQQLEENYPEPMVALIGEKLENVIERINFNTHKRSIAIYVSPVFEKVIYLDIPVEEKIIVDESFEIRDLVYCKKQLHKYLVLKLSEGEIKLFLGDTVSFVPIISAIPRHIEEFQKDQPEALSNFSDNNAAHEVVVGKFLHYIDRSLDVVLNAYPLPLFVMGPPKMLGHFRQLSKHTHSVVDYINGNYELAEDGAFSAIMAPYLADWKKVLQKDLLNRLETAAGARLLLTGMEAVWTGATHGKGRLLVVEKDYMFAAEKTGADAGIRKAVPPYHDFSIIHDAVDDVIEKVLESGGDIEFTDSGLLSAYQQIALITYY